MAASAAATLDADSRSNIIAMVENSCRDYVSAINLRDWDTSSPLWSSMSETFRADPAIGTFGMQQQTLADFLQSRAEICIDHPTYAVRILDLSTDLNHQANKAEVFMNLEVTGVPEGVVRQNVGILDFQPFDWGDETKWLCVRYRSFRGLGGPIMSPLD